MKSITPHNKKGERHGYWERYYTNGKPLFKGHYHNNERIGYWEFYDFNGILEEQIFYS
jgi:antitoxin component YwqK of YwqJK toxin-antitoxin module